MRDILGRSARSRRVVRIAAVALGLACAPALDAGPRQDRARIAPAGAADGAVLPGQAVIMGALRTLREEGDASREDELRRITAVGPDAVHAILALRSGRIAPADESGPLVDARALEFLLEALRTWPRDRVVERLLAELDGEPDLGTVMETIVLTAEIGGIRASGPILEALSGLDAELLRAPCLQAKLEDALRVAIRADPGGVAVIRPHITGSDPAVLVPVARALTEGRGSASVPLWTQMLHVNRALDLEVLKAMGEVDLRRLAGCDRQRTAAARDLVSSPDRRTRQTAVIVLGRLGDVDSFETMLDLLEDPEPSVARGALEALRELAHVSMPADYERWDDWYTSRLEWLELRAPELAVLARGGDADQAFEAVRELASVPLFRRELSLFVSEGLDHPDPGVAAAACHGLQALGEPTSIATLIDCLDDGRAPVREAARTALRALTGEELPSESELWLSWLRE